MKVSIITATYNSEQTIQSAIDSIKTQTHESIESIVIDGGSTDNTVNIINSNRNYIQHFVSEQDAGIYDALNKGIALATGDIIGILHSDDFFAEPTTIERVTAGFDEDTDAVYGDLDYVKKEKPKSVVRRWRSQSYRKDLFYKGWMPAHPTFFLRAEHFEKFGGYDVSFFTAADYELMLRMLFRHNLKANYIPKTLVKMRVGGQSNVTWKNRWIANQEDARAWRVNGIRPKIYTRWLKPLSKILQFM